MNDEFIKTKKELNEIIQKLDNYLPKAIPTTIKFSSRASVKITNKGQDHYYTIEYRRRKTDRKF